MTIEARKRYDSSEKGRKAHREARRRYRNTDKGRATERKWKEKYYSTDKGREARRRQKQRYLSTGIGKQKRREYESRYRKKTIATPKGMYKLLVYNSKHLKTKREVLIGEAEFIAWFQEQEKRCHYCGVKFTSNGRGDDSGRTIDRIDNNLPYQTGNIVLACRRCNRIKSNVFAEPQMLEIAEKYFRGVTSSVPLP